MLSQDQEQGVLDVIKGANKPLTTAQIYDRMKRRVSMKRPGEAQKYVTQPQIGRLLDKLAQENRVKKSEARTNRHQWEQIKENSCGCGNDPAVEGECSCLCAGCDAGYHCHKRSRGCCI